MSLAVDLEFFSRKKRSVSYYAYKAPSEFPRRQDRARLGYRGAGPLFSLEDTMIFFHDVPRTIFHDISLGLYLKWKGE